MKLAVVLYTTHGIQGLFWGITARSTSLMARHQTATMAGERCEPKPLAWLARTEMSGKTEDGAYLGSKTPKICVAATRVSPELSQWPTLDQILVGSSRSTRRIKRLRE